MRTWRAALFFLLLAIMLTISNCGKEDNLTIEKIAYDNSKDNSIVYINENGAYVPYLVLTSDYNGNTLLLRKYVLSELKPYKEHGEFWASYEYGSYYEESSIDEFLNTEFWESLSERTKELIVDSTIEVTDMESYDEWNYKTHEISRKVFLLSSVELGIEGLDGYTTTKEGTPLEYFKNQDYNVKMACFEDGVVCPYWTRTPELWETCTVVMIGKDVVGSCTADISAGVRPAFCVSGKTVISESCNIIEGERVYVITEDAKNINNT